MNTCLARVLLVFAFIGVIPTSCVQDCSGPCGCEPVFEERFFSVNTLSIETLYRTDRNRPIDPNHFYYHEGLFKGIWVSLLVEISEKTENQNIGGLFPATFACSPPNSVSTEALRSLRIINKFEQKINETVSFGAGQAVNEHFVLTQNFQQEFKLSDFMARTPRFQKDERIYLKFKTKPQQPIQLTVDIEVELDNGKVFTFLNEPMRIAPN